MEDIESRWWLILIGTVNWFVFPFEICKTMEKALYELECLPFR